MADFIGTLKVRCTIKITYLNARLSLLRLIRSFGIRRILSLTLNPTTNLKFYYFSPFLNEFLIESCAFWIVFATVRCFYVKVPSAGSIVCEMT